MRAPAHVRNLTIIGTLCIVIRLIYVHPIKPPYAANDNGLGKRFGDKAYAFEELVAEITSGRICYELELPPELHDSHASYVDHWLQILKADKSAIITAAAKSEQAFAWLAAHSGYGCEADEPTAAVDALPPEKLAA